MIVFELGTKKIQAKYQIQQKIRKKMKGLSKYVKQVIWSMIFELFHDGGRYHIETSPLICSANQWAGFYMITTSVMKELNYTLYNRYHQYFIWQYLFHIRDL